MEVVFLFYLHSYSLLVSENSSPGDVISDLLSPSLEAIASARTRVYMPVEVVMSSVKLLSTLIENMITGQSTFNINGKLCCNEIEIFT